MRSSQVAVAAALFFGLCAYTSPNKQFHIDMGQAASAWTVDKELVTDTNTFVLFKFTAASADATGERTVNWHKLTDLIANTDGFAESLAEGILADRYPKGAFTITSRVKQRDANGQPFYLFTAQGVFKGAPAEWTGIVRVFPGQGAAMAADVHSMKGQDTRDKLGINAAEILAWGTSLKPGE
ncbi:MAG: hypothetical protein ISS15_17850 [Alphaproteobacteria bacterium]|nr:hypothetical protein [Alphaproteobacteria bacterium]MBL6938935.1 hypothetical protein [Alphaproteobacteria bacterium]MBL7099527.1 hypothetical protein [Alphaproteobacteria bacterium]